MLISVRPAEYTCLKRKKPAKTKHIPWQKIAEIGRKQIGPVQVTAVSFASCAGKKPGKLCYIRWQLIPETAWNGKSFFDKRKKLFDNFNSAPLPAPTNPAIPIV